MEIERGLYRRSEAKGQDKIPGLKLHKSQRKASKMSLYINNESPHDETFPIEYQTGLSR